MHQTLCYRLDRLLNVQEKTYIAEGGVFLAANLILSSACLRVLLKPSRHFYTPPKCISDFSFFSVFKVVGVVCSHLIWNKTMVIGN